MKVWIDGKLKIDFKGISNTKRGTELSLRYGLYSSFISRYKSAFETQTMPQRIIFFDGVKEETNCKKLVGSDQCQKLLSQTVNEYEFFRYSGAKKLEINAIRRFPSSILE